MSIDSITALPALATEDPFLNLSSCLDDYQQGDMGHSCIFRAAVPAPALCMVQKGGNGLPGEWVKCMRNDWMIRVCLRHDTGSGKGREIIIYRLSDIHSN